VISSSQLCPSQVPSLKWQQISTSLTQSLIQRVALVMCWTLLLLRLLSCSAPHIIQSQLQEVLTTVVYCDYPQQWPKLLEAVMGHLTSGVSWRLLRSV
jgi:hypothetical protein